MREADCADRVDPLLPAGGLDYSFVGTLALGSPAVPAGPLLYAIHQRKCLTHNDFDKQNGVSTRAQF